ncbi:MAG TPA: GNAT family N-acetyltransferase [Nocardioidaceae bacterium]|nr:GNAT family N-acetyltransferase [Nocardioidaceae bacterium]
MSGFDESGFDRLNHRAVARVIGPDDWAAWREIRLRSLLDTPSAYGSTHEQEADYSEELWRSRTGGGSATDLGPGDSGPAVLAFPAGADAASAPIGMGAAFCDRPGWLHVVAMWVDPAWRGRRVSHRILDVIGEWAAPHELRLHLDVTIGNDAAYSSYLSYGFHPTEQTRPLREGSELECVRMALPFPPPAPREARVALRVIDGRCRRAIT